MALFAILWRYLKNKVIDIGDMGYVPEDEIMIFETADKSITVPVSIRNDTMWLSIKLLNDISPEQDEALAERFVKEDMKIFTQYRCK